MARQGAANLLGRLRRLINELSQTNSSRAKADILGRHTDTHPFLSRLFKSGPFHLTSASLAKVLPARPPIDTGLDTLEDVLDALESRSLTGDRAVQRYQQLIESHPEHAELLKSILDKDLRIRMGAKSILKVTDTGSGNHFLPVALAEDYANQAIQTFFRASLSHGDRWFASRKLDGVRCIVDVRKPMHGALQVHLRSRQGRSLSHLQLGSRLAALCNNRLDFAGQSHFVLDGEICSFRDTDHGLETSKEDFKRAAALVNTRVPKGQDGGLDFVPFDALTADDFYNNSRSETWSKRQSRLVQLGAHLPQTEVLSVAALDTMMETVAKSNAWEGVMLRRDAPYIGKRTKDLIKVKRFFDAEFPIISYELGPIRTIRNGKEVTEEVLTNLVIEHKGHAVSVGSGFSLDERRRFRELGDELKGRMATVCYSEETSNKHGQPSLRFPTFKALIAP